MECKSRLIFERICGLYAAAIVAFLPVLSLGGQFLLARIFGVWFLLTIVWIPISRRAGLARGQAGLMFSTILILTGLCWALGPEVGMQNAFFCLVGAPLILFGDRKRHVAVTLLLVIFAYFFLQGVPEFWRYSGPRLLDPAVVGAVRIFVAANIFVACILSFYYFYRENSRNEQRLSESVDELKRTQVLLVQGGKMAALGEMAGGIAHEINTPLALINLNSSLLQEMCAENPPDLGGIRSLAQTIEKTGIRISKIVLGLKVFSRDGKNDAFEEVSLRELISETIILCQERFRAHSVELKIVTVPDFALRCRGVQISQVLLNLLNNAHDAIAGLAEKWVTVEALLDRRDVVIRVTDSGPGLPAEVRERLFQPFFTTKGCGKGTGLGLSISRGIVHAHGGELSLDAAGKNTCFVIRLPIHQGQGVKKIA